MAFDIYKSGFLAIMLIVAGTLVWTQVLNKAPSTSVPNAQTCSYAGITYMIGQQASIGGTNAVCQMSATGIPIWSAAPSGGMTPQTNLPYTTTTVLGEAAMKCDANNQKTYNVYVYSALDETTSGYSLLNKQVYIVNSNGELLAGPTNTSATGSTTLTIGCAKNLIEFIGKGSDTYYSTTAYVKGQLYNGATIPTWKMVGNVPIGEALEEVRIPVKTYGTITLEMWNAAFDHTTDLYNSTIAAGANSANDIHFRVSQTTLSQGAQGVVVCLNYTSTSTSMVQDWIANGYTAGLTAEKDSNMIADQYSDCKQALVLKNGGQPLTLDMDTRTADPSQAEYILTFYASATNPAFNITAKGYDRDFFFAPGTYTFKYPYMTPNDDYQTNLGIATASEGTAIFQIL